MRRGCGKIQSHGGGRASRDLARRVAQPNSLRKLNRYFRARHDSRKRIRAPSSPDLRGHGGEKELSDKAEVRQYIFYSDQMYRVSGSAARSFADIISDRGVLPLEHQGDLSTEF